MGNHNCCMSRGEKNPPGSGEGKKQERVYFVKQTEPKSETHRTFGEHTEASMAIKTFEDGEDPEENLLGDDDSDSSASIMQDLDQKVKEQSPKVEIIAEERKPQKEYNFLLKLPAKGNQTTGECLDSSSKQDEEELTIITTRNSEPDQAQSIIQESEYSKPSKARKREATKSNYRDPETELPKENHTQSQNPETGIPKPENREDAQAKIYIESPQRDPEVMPGIIIEPTSVQADCAEVLEPMKEMNAAASYYEDIQCAYEQQEGATTQGNFEEVHMDDRANTEEMETNATFSVHTDKEPNYQKQSNNDQKELETQQPEARNRIINIVEAKFETEMKVNEQIVESLKTDLNESNPEVFSIEETKTPTENLNSQLNFKSNRNNRKSNTIQPKLKQKIEYIPKNTNNEGAALGEKSSTPKAESTSLLTPTKNSGKLVSALKSPNNSVTKNKEVTFANIEYITTQADSVAESNLLLPSKHFEAHGQPDTVTAGPKFDKKSVQELQDSVVEPLEAPKRNDNARFSTEDKKSQGLEIKIEDDQRLSEKLQIDVGTPGSRNSDFRTSVDSHSFISENSQTPRSSYVSSTSSRSNINDDEERPSKKKRRFRKYPTLKK